MRRIRGLARQMSVVCSLASVSMLAVALYMTLCYSSGPKITLDCISVYSNGQQPASAKQSGAAQQLTEPQNEDRSDAVHSDTVSSCNTLACTLDRETVLDHSKCPLNRPFLVYVYNTHLPDLFELKYPSVLATWETQLNSTKTATSNPAEACVFIAVVGPLKKSISKVELDGKVHALPHWNNSGKNHVLIDLSDTGHTSTVLNELNLGNSVIATGYASHSHQTHHILAPPILPASEDEKSSHVSRFHVLLGHSLTSILPVRRELFVYFEGQLVNSDGNLGQHSRLDEFRHAAYHLTAHIHIQGRCGWARGNILPGALDGEWALCDSWLSPQSGCHQSNFSLILGGSHGRTGTATYARLISSLRCGSIPVVIGVDRLPFDDIINWSKVAVSLPSSLMTDALAIMASMSTDDIMQYRKQGRFLFETYFSSHRRILESIVAIIRYKSFHPPLRAPDFTGTLLVTAGKKANNEQSNYFHNPISVYTEDLWNRPPGPFYMYPVTPVRSDSVYHRSPPMGLSAGPTTAGIKKDQLLRAGFTGAKFREQLRGNYREEMFTVVTITYHRNDQLMKMLASFEGCPYLAKVVVVWNNEEDPPSNMTWPDIGVPVEVRCVYACMYCVCVHPCVCLCACIHACVSVHVCVCDGGCVMFQGML